MGGRGFPRVAAQAQNRGSREGSGIRSGRPPPTVRSRPSGQGRSASERTLARCAVVADRSGARSSPMGQTSFTAGVRGDPAGRGPGGSPRLLLGLSGTGARVNANINVSRLPRNGRRCDGSTSRARRGTAPGSTQLAVEQEDGRGQRNRPGGGRVARGSTYTFKDAGVGIQVRHLRERGSCSGGPGHREQTAASGPGHDSGEGLHQLGRVVNETISRTISRQGIALYEGWTGRQAGVRRRLHRNIPHAMEVRPNLGDVSTGTRSAE